MAERDKPWFTKLKKALARCDHDSDPDAFAAFVAVVLEDTFNPVDFLAQVAGFTHDEEKSWIRGWAKGAIVPTPKMRRAILKGVREHFAQALKGA